MIKFEAKDRGDEILQRRMEEGLQKLLKAKENVEPGSLEDKILDEFIERKKRLLAGEDFEIDWGDAKRKGAHLISKGLLEDPYARDPNDNVRSLESHRVLKGARDYLKNLLGYTK